MKKLWQDISLHRGAAAVFLLYWITTVVTVPFSSSNRGIPVSVVALLLSNSLISGALISWWRGQASERTYSLGSKLRGGALAGVLIGEITLLVTKGGAIDELVGWLQGWPYFGQWNEVLGFAIAAGILGALLGSIGAACSAVLHKRPNAN